MSDQNILRYKGERKNPHLIKEYEGKQIYKFENGEYGIFNTKHQFWTSFHENRVRAFNRVGLFADWKLNQGLAEVSQGEFSESTPDIEANLKWLEDVDDDPDEWLEE